MKLFRMLPVVVVLWSLSPLLVQADSLVFIPLITFLAPKPTTIETVQADASGTPAIAIGRDGLPIIAYTNFACSDLAACVSVVRCKTRTCAEADPSTVLDDTSASPSIAIGADGLPIFAYNKWTYIDDNLDEATSSIKVAHCAQRACTSATLNTLHTVTDTVQLGNPVITIGGDGLPFVVFKEGYPNHNLVIVHCDDAACAKQTKRILPAYITLDVTAAIGGDGLPILAFGAQDTITGEAWLEVRRCSDAACSAHSHERFPMSGDTISVAPHIAIGPDGLPVIGFIFFEWNGIDEYEGRFRLLRCENPPCTGATPIAINDTHDAFQSTIAIGGDGLPVAAYGYGLNPSAINVIHCDNAACTESTVRTISRPLAYPALAIGLDRLPVIATTDILGGLVVVHCGDLLCTSP